MQRKTIGAPDRILGGPEAAVCFSIMKQAIAGSIPVQAAVGLGAKIIDAGRRLAKAESQPRTYAPPRSMSIRWRAQHDQYMQGELSRGEWD